MYKIKILFRLFTQLVFLCCVVLPFLFVSLVASLPLFLVCCCLGLSSDYLNLQVKLGNTMKEKLVIGSNLVMPKSKLFCFHKYALVARKTNFFGEVEFFECKKANCIKQRSKVYGYPEFGLPSKTTYTHFEMVKV